MKKKISAKIIIPILGLLFVLPFIYDLYRFYSDVDIITFDYIAEGFSVIFGLLYYLLLSRKVNFQDKSIQDNLKIFVYLLGIMYLSVIISQLLLNPSYSSADTPPLPETLGSVIYANIVSVIGILLMVPIFIVIKNLIYYKRTRRTYFFMQGVYIFTAAAIISGVVSRSLLPES